MTGHTAYRAEVDGLRAVAVLLVILFHAGVPALQGGFVGVDVFFVISGYLITQILKAEIDRTGALDLLNFYARRARRLLPAAALVTVATLVISSQVLSPLETMRLIKPAAATAVYASNIWFILQGGDYFGGDLNNNPFLHTWSLSVEEQFYLVWPIIVLVGIRYSRKRGPAYLFALLSVLSLALCVWMTTARPLWAFYGTPFRIWEFGAGALACLIPPGESRHRPAVGWLGLAAILVSAVTFTPQISFPGLNALVPVAGTVALLYAGAGIAPLGWPVFTGLGKISYSLYLWHWPLLTTAAVFWPNMGTGGRLCAVLVAIPLAAGTRWLVEMPVRYSPYLSKRKMLSLALAATTVLAVLSAVALARLQSNTTADSPEQKAFIAAGRDRTQLVHGCLATSGSSNLVECTFGPANATESIILFGDSHAEQLFPALEPAAAQRHAKLVTMVRTSCPTPEIDIFNSHLKRIDDECSRWREKALLRIAALQPSLVVIANDSGYTKPAEWERGTRATLARLTTSATRTLLIRDTPHPDLDVPVCLSRAALQGGGAPETQCLVQRSAALNEAIWNAEQAAAGNTPSVTLLDLTDSFCNANTCPTILGGIPVYRDTNHISTRFAAQLTDVLAGRIAIVTAPQHQEVREYLK